MIKIVLSRYYSAASVTVYLLIANSIIIIGPFAVLTCTILSKISLYHEAIKRNIRGRVKYVSNLDSHYMNLMGK